MTPVGDALDASVTLTRDVYTPAAIEQTIRAFHELCGAEANVGGESTDVRLYCKSGGPSTVCDDFLNYALELSVQELLNGKE
jgi:hypothetical protein